MINTDDKLICIKGNEFYAEGQIYTFGRIVNNKYFQQLTGSNDDHWYATLDDEGIYVSFDYMSPKDNKAWFDKMAQEVSIDALIKGTCLRKICA